MYAGNLKLFSKLKKNLKVLAAVKGIDFGQLDTNTIVLYRCTVLL